MFQTKFSFSRKPQNILLIHSSLFYPSHLTPNLIFVKIYGNFFEIFILVKWSPICRIFWSSSFCLYDISCSYSAKRRIYWILQMNSYHEENAKNDNNSYSTFISLIFVHGMANMHNQNLSVRLLTELDNIASKEKFLMTCESLWEKLGIWIAIFICIPNFLDLGSHFLFFLNKYI